MDEMPRIELPHALERYFAHAELPGNRNGRRFTITFPYFEGERLDRLQWWWQWSTAQERVGGEAGLEALRREATDRFRQHIERWLSSSRKHLFDGNPFPRLASAPVVEAAAAEDQGRESLESSADWMLGRVSNG